MASVKRFEDLICWQLSEQLKELVFKYTDKPRIWNDRKFCEQIHESARSAPANIAEGWGWYDPKPNARHVSIAKASLEETKNHVYEGVKRRHFNEQESKELFELQRRALGATRRYLRYLKSCKTAPEGRPFEPRAQNAQNAQNAENAQNPWNPNDRNPGTEPQERQEPSEPLEPIRAATLRDPRRAP